MEGVPESKSSDLINDILQKCYLWRIASPTASSPFLEGLWASDRGPMGVICAPPWRDRMSFATFDYSFVGQDPSSPWHADILSHSKRNEGRSEGLQSPKLIILLKASCKNGACGVILVFAASIPYFDGSQAANTSPITSIVNPSWRFLMSPRVKNVICA